MSPKQLGNDLDLLGLASEKKDIISKIWEQNYASLSARSNYENADDE